jgi:signal transduction histidine kinase
LELEKANDDLRRKEAIQSLLKELSQDIASQDVDALLKKLADKVREFFKVDIADVRIIDKGVPRILAVSGGDEGKMKLGSIGSGKGASKWILENRKPLVIPDVTLAERSPIGKTTHLLGLRGYLAVPFFTRSGEVLGVLRALTYQPRDFLQEEIDLLQQMTNGAAIALENARLLEQTKIQAAELMQANKVKNEFLGFVSHELRTPVNVIMGFSAIIQSKMLGEINAEQDNALEKVSANSKDLLSMIDKLLEATRIEAGAIKPEIHEVHLLRFLDDMKSVYAIPLKNELRLDWIFPADLPVIRTDEDKLRHILQNVVNNAIKYTRQGSVAVSARYIAETGEVEFEVADTGIGIPKEELPRIFEMFSQVKVAHARSGGGVGLGLHIVKKFTEALGGEILVTSEEGKGSTFFIRIPCDVQNGQSDNPELPGIAMDGQENKGAALDRPLPQADS